MKRLVSVQHVMIRWSKDQRNPEGGARRKALPRTFPFAPPKPSDKGWIHRIVMDAGEDYVPRETWRELPLKADLDGIFVQPDDAFAEVFLTPGSEHLHLQKPRRGHLSGLIARLPFDMRLLVRVNTAWDGHIQRHYDDHVIQIGYSDRATLDLPLFREIDERADLY